MDKESSPGVQLLVGVWRRKIQVYSTLVGVVVASSCYLKDVGGFKSLIAGATIVGIGILLDILFLLSHHDDSAASHYSIARQRYKSFQHIEDKLFVRVLDDLSALIAYIEADIRRVFGSAALPERCLFIRLIKLDLETLEKRLSDMKNRSIISLDTHQMPSHRIICEVMKDEKIQEFSAIYDLRDGAIQLNDFDKSFSTELDRLVKEMLVKVRGLLIVADEADESTIANLAAAIQPYFCKERYSVVYITNSEYNSLCRKFSLDDLQANPDVGIYGERYVYIGSPASAGSVPHGTFLRSSEDVKKYRNFFDVCWADGKVINLSVSPRSDGPACINQSVHPMPDAAKRG